MSAIQAEVQVVEAVQVPCLHAQVESIGSGGSATYRRCLGCGGVLVTFAGRVWLVPAKAPRATAEGSEGRASARERRGGAR